MPLFAVQDYPSFVIMKYNFNQSKYEYNYYPSSDFTEEASYHAVKKFVSEYTLETPRNDLLFHKIAK